VISDISVLVMIPHLDQDEKENQNEASNNRLDDLDSDEDDDFMAQYRAKR